MGRQIDADEFIRHAQNMIDIAKRDNNRMMEAFLLGIQIYFQQYLDTFENKR